MVTHLNLNHLRPIWGTLLLLCLSLLSSPVLASVAYQGRKLKGSTIPDHILIRGAQKKKTGANAKVKTKVLVNAPAQVMVGEYFNVEYIVVGGEDLSVEVDNVPIAQGLKQVYEAQDPSLNVVTINGHMTYETTIKYIYTYVADKVGSYTLGGFLITDQAGASLSAPQKTITVTDKARSAESSKHFYEYRIELDKTTVYEQEPIIATAKLYASSRSVSLQYGYQIPFFDSFVAISVPAEDVNNTFVNATFKGKNCYSVELGKMILYPTASGRQTIDPDYLDISVYVPNQKNHFLSEQEDRSLTSSEIQVQVKPLPQEGRPVDYSDAVGQFSLKAESKEKKFATNKAFVYSVYIKGSGDLRTGTVQMNKDKASADLEFYPPNVQHSEKVVGNAMEATKVYEYTVIPRKAGRNTLPSFSFVYFDPSAGAYRRLETKPVVIDVEVGEAASEDVLIYGKGGDGYDWSLTSRKGARAYTGYSFVYSWVYLLLNLLFVALGYIAYWLLKRHFALKADAATYNAKRANTIVHKRLAQANKLLGQGEYQAFYEEVQRALWSYVQDKFALPSERLSRSSLREALQSIGAHEQDVDLWLRTIDALEFARFASGSSSISPEELYKQAEEAIARVEQITKQK